MKIEYSIGASAKKDLLRPIDCFEVGKQATRVSDGLALAEFAFRSKKIGRAQLGLLAVGLGTSLNQSSQPYLLNFPDSVKNEFKGYSRAASPVAKLVSNLSKTKKSLSKDERAALEKSVNGLRKKVNTLSNSMEKRCYLVPEEKKPGLGPIARAGMGSSAQVSTAPAPAPTAAAPLAALKPSMKKNVFPAFSRPALHKSIRRRP